MWNVSESYQYEDLYPMHLHQAIVLQNTHHVDISTQESLKRTSNSALKPNKKPRSITEYENIFFSELSSNHCTIQVS